MPFFDNCQMKKVRGSFAASQTPDNNKDLLNTLYQRTSKVMSTLLQHGNFR